LNSSQLRHFIHELWSSQIVPQLIEYIKIPNKSPAFDPDWAKHGYMDQAVAQLETWAGSQPIPGIKVEVVRLSGRTPLIYIEIPGPSDDGVLLYGHLDKQPEMSGWSPRLGPWTPVLEGDKLYGRGSADDGYALFGALAAIMALQDQGVPHARCVVLIEACEESGSFDLPHYVDHLAARLGRPSLVVCLDSGCANYEQLWLTSSLRGLAGGVLTVRVLEEGVHSGDASGIVPSAFRILRQLLSRLEEEGSGQILPLELHVQIPSERIEQARHAAETLGDAVYAKFPLGKGMRPMDENLAELVLNRTWRPALSVIGADGLPPLPSAGNVLLPCISLKLSLRLPPTLNPDKANAFLKTILEKDSPYGAEVTFKSEGAAAGWNAPRLSPWLARCLEDGSKEFFGTPPGYMGEGGTIPFMGMLSEKFPAAQFVITGVLGPGSNAHGPNEFLHIPTGERVTACVARVLADHYVATRPELQRPGAP
jgi:acetylornithine deacetylase/succinyl-diaminopimelate desuccinylase-like protein